MDAGLRPRGLTAYPCPPGTRLLINPVVIFKSDCHLWHTKLYVYRGFFLGELMNSLFEFLSDSTFEKREFTLKFLPASC